MRPTTIPDSEIWPGAHRRVVAPPGGDLTDPDIAPVEALVDQTDIGRRYSMRCVLEGDDLDVLRGGGVVWVQMLGDRLQPFQIGVAGGTPGCASLRVDVTPGDDAPSFDVWLNGVSGVDPKLFVAGCVEALQKILDDA